MARLRSLSLVVALLVLAWLAELAQAASSPEQIEFFENKVRPIFAENCYTCHSEKAEKLKGGLKLDSPENLLKGGDSGPVVVPGNLDSSLLIKAVRYTDLDLQMPPKNKKLSDQQIASLEEWVKMGAPMPAIAAASRSLRDVSEARARHWAFKPVKKPTPPPVKNRRWVQTPVDNFVLAKLEQNHLKPAPPADRRTLIRRMSYDLTGLPPTYEEVEAFVKDRRPDAVERLVDRLLASPHYGERWARYWLDVARFADTKGYLAGGEERRYPFSYTYRDYVIRAFNEDKPYDRFVIEQIAADLIPVSSFGFRVSGRSLSSDGEQLETQDSKLETALAGGDAGAPRDRSSLAALGFLTLGRRFLNNQNDIIDDRIDVVTRGMLGLTVTCARCHDHKFDPISSKDYYALNGILASSEEPAERPLLGPLRDSPDYQDFLKQKAKIEAEIEDYKSNEVAQFLNDLRQHVGDYLLGAHEAAGVEDAKFETFAGEHKLNPTVLRRWMKELEACAKTNTPTRTPALPGIIGPWLELSKLPEADFAEKAKMVGTNAGSNSVVIKALEAAAIHSLKDAAEAYNKLFKDIDSEWKAALVAATKENKPAPTALPDSEREALRQILYAEGAPPNVPRSDAEGILARKLGEPIAQRHNKIEALNWTHPGAPPRAMALADRATPANSHVLLRGNPANPGDEVPRRFLTVLSDVSSAPFTNGSGRLELARAITNPDNPLTARVYVNRVWLHHFGEGLVSTPGDFGVRTEEPVQRVLLDYLAASFVESGWSTKALHRMILLSSTYQESSMPESKVQNLKSKTPDPDNRLFSHFDRQRLDFEALRDTLLAISGKLDSKLGGLPVEIESEPFSTRRTVYGMIDRQNLPAVYRTFDFANPDTSNQGRFHTTVPQQALFLMNSPFVLEQARALAKRPEIGSAKTTAEKVQALYRLAFQRPASKSETEMGQQFLMASPLAGSKLSSLEEYSQALLLSNELVYVD